jgi:hypothetical protein
VARAPKPPGMRPDAPPRSYKRSARMDLLMSPELMARLTAAAAAAGRPRLPYVVELIERALPPELPADETAEETSMAS